MKNQRFSFDKKVYSPNKRKFFFALDSDSGSFPFIN